MPKDAEVEQIKQALRKGRRPEKIKRNMLLSSGSTLINMAATGHPNGYYIKGKYHLYVGASKSGKTWMCLCAFAEATNSKRFADYRLIYDAPEDGALMDIAFYFGDAVAQRLEPPERDSDGDPVYSEYVEDFYDHLDDAFQNGSPFIYVLDSMDALTTRANEETYKEQKAARRKGTKVPGSYGDVGKAKINSEMLRRAVGKLKKSGSILIIISQERDNIAPMAREKKTRAGGRSLDFYATSTIWTSSIGSLKKTVNKKPRQIGNIMLAKIKKNRAAGRERAIQVPIYHSYGVDDTGSCVDYLLSEGHWRKAKGIIRCPEWEVALGREDLIQHIEREGLEPELRQLVADVWDGIEAACALSRKKRYGKQETD